MPLERKIQISQTRIIERYKHWGGQVVVSFSGGKDSTVLLHLVRSVFPDVKAVFSNTGLEYPEIQKHVMSVENVDIVRPSMRFDEVISTYGYPLIGKEVAEAIYYARRIRSHSCNVERERERRQSSTGAGNSWDDGQPYRDERSEKQKNNPARTMGREADWKRMEFVGGADQETAAEPEIAQTDPQRGIQQSRGKHPSSGKWKDYHRRCLNPDESNPEDKDRFWNKPAKTAWADWRRGCL